jgi:hypothetical protein
MTYRQMKTKITKEEWLRRGMEPDVWREMLDQYIRRTEHEIETLQLVVGMLRGESLTPEQISRAAKHIADHPEILKPKEEDPLLQQAVESAVTP